jgi:hypothetical protein
VTITVSDGNGGSATITVTINITNVDEIPVNNDPVFIEGSSATRSIAENTGSGVDIGTAVSATDDDNDTLAWTLGGTDGAAFSIDSTTGQLRTSASLDHETKDTYTVTITVSDGNGGSATITVTINITNVDEIPVNNDPVFIEGSSATRSRCRRNTRQHCTCVHRREQCHTFRSREYRFRCGHRHNCVRYRCRR